MTVVDGPDADHVVPPGGPQGRIYDTMRNVLNAYVDYFEQYDVDLPKDEQDEVISFVSDGTIGYDQPLFAIEFLRLRPGSPGVPAAVAIRGDSEYSIETTVHLIRSVPVVDEGGLPTPEEREGSAQELLLDAWMLFQGAIDLTRAAMEGGPSTFVGAPYRRVMIQDIAPYGPSGGIGGSVATLVLELV